MKKTAIAFLIVSLTMALVMPIGAHALAPAPIRITVDGALLNIDHRIVNGRVLVPAQEIATRLEARLTWEQEARRATFTRGAVSVSLVDGWHTAVRHGRFISLDVAPLLVNDTLFVPLRFLANELGQRVAWVDATRTVTLATLPTVTVNIAAPEGVPALSFLRMLNERPPLGVNVTANYEIIRSPDLLAARVIAGEADIAIVPTNLAAVLHNRNIPYRIAASTVWGVLYVVSNEPIRTWSDLRGRQVHTFGRGLTPDIAFRYLLAQNGLQPDVNVTLNYMGSGAEVAQAMIAGRIHTAVLAEPVLSQVMSRRPGLSVVLDLQREWGRATGLGDSFPQTSLIISNRLIENQPEFVERFLQEVEHSIAWVHNNPTLAGAAAERLGTGMAANIVEWALPRTNLRFVRAAVARRSIDAYLKVLFEFDPQSVGGRLPGDALYHTR